MSRTKESESPWDDSRKAVEWSAFRKGHELSSALDVLDVLHPDTVSTTELDAFRDGYERAKGRSLAGHEFLLEFRPDVLKRYALAIQCTRKANQADGDPTAAFLPGAFIHAYAIWGWTAGIEEHLFMAKGRGVTKKQVLDIIAIAYLHCGPRGTFHLAQSATDFLREWDDSGEQHIPEIWPKGWAFERDAFASGMNFEDPKASNADLDALQRWYRMTMGEIPRHVTFLSEHAPDQLKAYRNRLENAIVGGLPKQMLPSLMLQNNVYRGFREGIREAALLGRATGMTREQIASVIRTCAVYGGPEAIEIAADALRDVLPAMA